MFSQLAPVFQGVAHAILYGRFFGQVYFMVIVSWAAFYMFAGLRTELPWDTCTEDWNTVDCYSIKYNDKCEEGEIFWNFECSAKEDYCVGHGYEHWDSAYDTCTSAVDSQTVDEVLAVYGVSPTEDYFNGKVLRVTKNKSGEQYSWGDYGGIRWELVLCQLFGWSLMTLINIRGIRSLGKAAYVLTIFPYVLLTILLIYALTLDGASDGIDFYMSSDWSKLSDTKIWLDACVQIIMSTAVACGTHLVLASFNPPDNKVYVDASVIGILNSLTSLYAGFAVFSMTGFLAYQTRSPVESVRIRSF